MSLPPADRAAEDVADDEDVLAERVAAPGGPREGAEGEDAAVARINLRLPERLKTRVEQAAGGEGLSVNAWLVRAAARSWNDGDRARGRERRTPQRAAQRYTGWAR